MVYFLSDQSSVVSIKSLSVQGKQWMMNCMLSHRIWCPLSVVILRMSVLDLCIPGMIEDWMIQRRKLHQEGFVLMEIEENISSTWAKYHVKHTNWKRKNIY
jgi:hypothetical protein